MHSDGVPMSIGPFEAGQQYSFRFSYPNYSGWLNIWGNFDENDHELGFLEWLQVEDFDRKMTVTIEQDGRVLCTSP